MIIDIDPNILVLGPFVLSWHGLFSAVGLAVGIWIVTRLLRDSIIPEDEVMTTAFWGTIGGLLGARLLHVVDQWDYYSARPVQILLLNEGGIAIFGAIIGGVLAGLIYALVRHLPVGLLADASGIGLILGQAIGRIGDVINGEHHGTHLAESAPWSVTYVHPNTLAETGVPVHLAVGYELVLDLLIYGLLLGLWGRTPRPGMLFWLYMLLYSVGRFAINFFRQDTAVAFGMAQAQLVALATVAVAIWFLVYLVTRAPRAPQAPALATVAATPSVGATAEPLPAAETSVPATPHASSSEHS